RQALAFAGFTSGKFHHRQKGPIMAKQLKQIERSERESRIVKVRYDDTTGVIDFGIFVVQPDGKKARVLGGGAFEEQDLYCVAAELANLANDFACSEALNFQGIEDGEGEE